jgi:hypothetical protein
VSVVGSLTTTGAISASSLTTSGDALINTLTVGKGGGNRSGNTALGNLSLPSNTTGNQNTAAGYLSLYSNAGGTANSAYGVGALYFNNSGSFNTAVGANALNANSSAAAQYNTAVGNSALYYSTGAYNTAAGAGALYYNTTGQDNTAVGTDAGPATGALSNTTAIGRSAIPAASNRVRIGNAAVTQIGGQVAWSTLSDRREKENIADYAHGLDFIMKLRPVTYNMIDDKTKVTHSGFIAQEVEKIGIPFYGLNKPANDKDFYSLSYAEFVVPLVNSVKELKKENDQLKADNSALLKRVEAIEARLK